MNKQSIFKRFFNWLSNLFGGSSSATTASTTEIVPVGQLTTTQSLTKSKKEMKQFVSQIEAEGVQESVKYVSYNGEKYVVDGHHRLYAVKLLGQPTILAERVSLPYKGYQTYEDLYYW